MWKKPSHHTKQRKTENVPLSPPALALFRKIRETSTTEHVFPGRDDKTVALTTVRGSWNTIRRHAGLPAVRLHDLRPSFASFLVSNGVSLYETGKLMGHANAATTERYAQLSKESQQKATNVMGTLYNGLTLAKKAG